MITWPERMSAMALKQTFAVNVRFGSKTDIGGMSAMGGKPTLAAAGAQAINPRSAELSVTLIQVDSAREQGAVLAGNCKN